MQINEIICTSCFSTPLYLYVKFIHSDHLPLYNIYCDVFNDLSIIMEPEIRNIRYILRLNKSSVC